MTQSQDYIVEPLSAHTASVIFLHGLGDDGCGWSQILKGIREPHIRYICPSATVKPVTVNRGTRMPSWFDVHGFTADSQQDETGIQEAAQLLQSYIAKENKHGIDCSRIVIGGISQGGAVTLYSTFAIEQQPLAGVFVLSTWLPLHTSFPAVVKSNQLVPILQCHGDADHLVTHEFGKMASQVISSFNDRLQFKSYPGLGHWYSQQEMMDVKDFIVKCLPAV